MSVYIHQTMWVADMVRSVSNDKLHILLVGAGILGSRVLAGLLDAGFRRIVVDDEFTVSDRDVDMLHFFPDDVGRGKRSTTAVDRVPKPSDAHIVALSTSVPSMDSWNYDVYLGCSCINRDRSIINAHAREYEIPYIDGMVSDGMWRLQTVGRRGPCVGCFLRDSSVDRPTEDPRLAGVLSERMVDELVDVIRDGIPMNPGVCFSSEGGLPVRLYAGTSPECIHHSKHGV